MTWPGPQPTSTTGRPSACATHPVEQPRLERQPGELVGQVVGVGARHGVVRRPDPRVTLVRALREDDVAVDRRGDCRGRLRRRAEEVDPATVVLPRSPLELADQRLGAPGHPAQARLDVVTTGEGVQSLGAGPQLARCLRTSQQQHGDDRALVGLERQPLVEDLVVLQCPPAGVGPHDPQQAAVLQRPRDPRDGLLVVVDDRLPAARLVAGGAQRVALNG